MTKPQQPQVYLAGYSDRLSARPGETIRFHVSSQAPSGVPVHARLTKSISADPNPQGPGVVEYDANEWFEPTTFPSRTQLWDIGSWATSSRPLAVSSSLPPSSSSSWDAHSLELQVWCFPTRLPCPHVQHLCSWGPLYLSLNDKGFVQVMWDPSANDNVKDDDDTTNQSTTRLVTVTMSTHPLVAHKWYKCGIQVQKETASMVLTITALTTTHLELLPPQVKTESLAVLDDKNNNNINNNNDPTRRKVLLQQLFSIDNHFYLSTNGTFNGKLEDPRILVNGKLLASWKLSENMTSWSIPPSREQQQDDDDNHHDMKLSSSPFLLLKNAPTRAVKGRLWDGSEMNWQRRPKHYAAIYFHDDDVYDFGWESDFGWTIPDHCPSGIYIMRIEVVQEPSSLTGDEQQQRKRHYDAMPIFVCPPAPQKTTVSTLVLPRQAKVCVLISTFTYIMYGNHARPDFDLTWLKRIDDWKAYPHNPAMYPEYGQSTYNYHSDGVAGICHASHKRPLFNLRPGYQTFGQSNCSGLRHFPADSHLIAWFHNKDIAYEIITDDELDREGSAVLQGYQCLVTGTHPEYHTERTLNALQEYRNAGGNLAYLGGNGFYWRIVRHAQEDDDDDDNHRHDSLLEIRRAEGGIRAWASEPGEYYSAFDGSYGGLWRRSGRPPQHLVGVGFTAQGTFVSLPYQRVCWEPALDWIFDGLSTTECERLGDFGYSGGGAAGFELDRVDPQYNEQPYHNDNDGNALEGRIVVLARSVHDDDNQFVLVPEEVLTHLTILSGGQMAEAKRADMVYWKTLGHDGHGRGGGQVFSTGSICFCGSLPWNDFNNSISKGT